MKDTDDLYWLDVVLSNDIDPSHDVDIKELHRALESFYKLVYLVNAALCTQLSNKDTAPSMRKLRSEFNKSFTLTCRPSIRGSFVVHVALRQLNTEYALDVVDQREFINAEALKESFRDLLSDVSSGAHDSFLRKIPNINSAKQVARAIEQLCPSSDHSLRLKLASESTLKLFDSNRDLEQTKVLINMIESKETPALYDKESTLIASIDTVDLEEKSFTAKTNEGLRMTGYLNDVFEPKHDILKENKIECDGVFKVDDDLNVLSVSREGKKRPVDVSPVIREN